jgi:UTP-glucose-1-phosphate uridylyltransferase/mevalonate kinase
MIEQSKITLFVPGRLCLFGEHSDWAGMHRMINSEVEIGRAIVTGVEEGIYATAECDDDFIMESELPFYQGNALRCTMDTESLLNVAKSGGFFSYVAGVASYLHDNYSVGGARITITAMDLPMKSGLSSSAAICVLVARAFNQLYRLRLNTKGEMLVAFRGEQRTPSRCGRLDQACAYGVNPVYMEFDGVEISTKQLRVGKTMYWVVADLQSAKDTIKILSDLNKCYPFAENDKEQNVHEALGRDNAEYIRQAVAFLESGDAQGLGKLMSAVQSNFDQKVAPACLSQLKAPILHATIHDPIIQQWIYGAKGVGSQGDGSVQFLAKDENSRTLLMRYLSSEKKMPSFSLTLYPGRKIKRAIIPLAGFGTRLYPMTKGIKKSFLPVLDRDGLLKPAILLMIEQLVEADIEEICLVIGSEEEEYYRSFFSPISNEYRQQLSEERLEYEEKIVQLGKKISFVFQDEKLGMGHAVYLCKEFAKNDPVLLLLGDMIYTSNIKTNCSRQFMDAYEKYGRDMVAIHEIPLSDVIHYGIVQGEWETENVLKVDQIVEKPSLEFAEENLGVVDAYGQKKYFAMFGQYAISSEVFSELGQNIRQSKMSKGEYQLVDALNQVKDCSGMYAFVPKGESLDLGLPQSYCHALWQYAKSYV